MIAPPWPYVLQSSGPTEARWTRLKKQKEQLGAGHETKQIQQQQEMPVLQ